MTVDDSFPTSNISDILNLLGLSKKFSTLNAAQFCHAISNEEKSRPLTVFATAFGLYHFAHMPFGLKNAGAAYCRLVCRMINMLGVEGIHTQDSETHLNLLNFFFQTHREARIKLNANKTFLFRTEVKYLCNIVSQDGIKL